MVYHATDADLTALVAMLVIVFQNNDWLLPAFTGVFYIASAEVTIIAVVSTDWTDTVLVFE